MRFFNIFKRQDKEENTGLSIKILGFGCYKCKQLEKNIHQALRELERSESIEYIVELSKIIEYGVVFTPTLVINEEVVAIDEELSVEEIKSKILQLVVEPV